MMFYAVSVMNVVVVVAADFLFCLCCLLCVAHTNTQTQEQQHIKRLYHFSSRCDLEIDGRREPMHTNIRMYEYMLHTLLSREKYTAKYVYREYVTFFISLPIWRAIISCMMETAAAVGIEVSACLDYRYRADCVNRQNTIRHIHGNSHHRLDSLRPRILRRREFFFALCRKL